MVASDSGGALPPPPPPPGGGQHPPSPGGPPPPPTPTGPPLPPTGPSSAPPPPGSFAAPAGGTAAPRGRRPWPWILGGAAIVAAVVLAIVVSDGDDDPAEEASDTTASASDGTESEDTVTDETATDDTAVAGDAYAGDSWTMIVPDSWSEIDPFPPAEVQWATGTRSPEFFTNVNVFVDTSAPGSSIEEYVELSADNADNFGMDVDILDTSVEQFDDGGTYGRMLYDIGGDVPIRALGIFVEVDGGHAVVTMVAEPEDFDADLAEIQPFMLTLRAD